MQRYCRLHLVAHTSTVKSSTGSSITNVDFGWFRPNKIPEFHEVKIQQQTNLVISYTKHYCIEATSRPSLKGQIWQSPPMVDTRSIPIIRCSRWRMSGNHDVTECHAANIAYSQKIAWYSKTDGTLICKGLGLNIEWKSLATAAWRDFVGNHCHLAYASVAEWLSYCYMEMRQNINSYVCMYVFIYVCMYVCMYICMYVCMYACMCIYICVYLFMYVLYMYVYMYVCMYVCIYVGMFVCMYVCMNVWMYACM